MKLEPHLRWAMDRLSVGALQMTGGSGKGRQRDLRPLPFDPASVEDEDAHSNGILDIDLKMRRGPLSLLLLLVLVLIKLPVWELRVPLRVDALQLE